MVDIQNIWEETLNKLSSRLNAIALSLWINKLSPYSVKDKYLILIAPTEHAKTTIINSYADDLNECIKALYPSLEGAKIVFGDEVQDYMEADTTLDNELLVISDPKVDLNSTFLKRYTFDNFVVGEPNNLAFRAAQAVAQNPGGSDGFLNLNPLFIYGGVGLGKTHLLHSIGNYIRKHFPNLVIKYIPTEEISNHFFETMQKVSTDKNAFVEFRAKYRKVDVLMFDDVQFLKKKTGLQDIIFQIFNDLYQKGKQIILSSDRPPKEIPALAERLRSRFEWGLIADISDPDLDMRIAIIRKKMQLEKVAVSDEVVTYIAETIDTNVRELEGALTKVVLYSQLKGIACPDITIAKEALKAGKGQEGAKDITGERIIDSVASYFGISKAEIIGKKKKKEIVEARMVAVYMVNEALSMPLVAIGQMFGGRDHTTVIHSRDKITEQLKTDVNLERKIKDIWATMGR